MKTTLEILREARELISVPERWTQGHYAKTATRDIRDPLDLDAVCWCMLGAIRRVGAIELGNVVPLGVFLALERACGADRVAIHHFNDTHTHAGVLAAFDKAIEAIEAEEQK